MKIYRFTYIPIVLLLVTGIYSQENNPSEIPLNVKIDKKIRQYYELKVLKITFIAPSESGDADSVMLRYKLNSPDSTYPQNVTDGITLSTYPHDSIYKDKSVFERVDDYGDYYISAFVRNTSGNWSEYSDNAIGHCTIIDYDEPENIGSLRAVPQKNLTISLTWSQSISEDAEIIRICYDTIFKNTHNTDHFVEFDAKGSITTGEITKFLVEKKEYYINAFVRDPWFNWSDGSLSARDTVITYDTTPPLNVTNVSAQAQPNRKIKLTWTPSESEDACCLKICWLKNENTWPQTQDEGESIELAHSKTEYILEGITEKTTYYFSLFVKDDYNNWSKLNVPSQDSVTTYDETPPGNITGLTGKDISKDRIFLSWSSSDSSDADSIMIQYNTDGTFPDSVGKGSFKKVISHSAISDTLTGLNEKTKYYISFFVKDIAGNWSTYSDAATISFETPDVTPPDNPLVLTAEVKSTESIELSWNPKAITAQDAMLVEIRYMTSEFPANRNMGKVIGSITLEDSSYTVKDLQEFKEYYFSIFLIDSSGNYVSPPEGARVKATTWFKPRLLNTEGIQGPLSVFIADHIAGLVTIEYQLLDLDAQSNSVSLEYRKAKNTSWEKITYMHGDTGSVPASDSSVHRSIQWYARKQLTDEFDRDSLQVRIISTDTNLLSDTSAMASSSLVLDLKAPKAIRNFHITHKKPFEVHLAWDAITSTDADTILLLHGKSQISGVADTAKFSYIFLPPSTMQYTVHGLKSDTYYHFALFIGDKVPNWSAPSYDSGRTSNDLPVCECSPIENEQSKDVIITCRLSDIEHDELSIKAYFSNDGNSWDTANISGDTGDIISSQYIDIDRTIIWHSNTDLPDVYSDSVLFTILPYDKQEGRGDTIRITVDNYHGHTVKLIPPQDRQTGDILFPYTVSDSTYDTLFFSGYFSIDGGIHWTATENVYPKVITPQEYNGSIKWNSDADIGEKAYDSVQFAIVPSDGWEDGSSDTTSSFSVDNTPIIEFIDTPNVINDTVEFMFRVISRTYDSLSLQKSYFSYGDNKINIPGLSRSNVIYRSRYDSITITWPSKNDFTSNASEVTMFFQFSVGNFIREIKSPVFSLNNNEIPKISVSEILSEQHGDVTITASIEDTDQDTIQIAVEYYNSLTGKWKSAFLEDNGLLINPLKYDGFSVVWKSASDIPTIFNEDVSVRIVPFDQDTGNADTVSFKLTNLNVPVCEEIRISDQHVLSDKIQIVHILKDKDQSFLDLDLYYFFDSQWVKTENIYGNIDSITNDAYIDTIIWYSSIEFPGTVIPEIKLKLVPRDDISGQSAVSRTFKLDNTLKFPEITGDFTGDGTVSIDDFVYASRYWSMSAMDTYHPDSLQELAPAHGTPPFKIVMPDSVFDYSDLKAFTELCYWWFYNSPSEQLVKYLPKYASKRSSLQVISFTRSVDVSEIDLHFKTRDIHDLNSCKYRVYINTPHVFFKKIYVSDTWKFDAEGTIHSVVINDSVKADIGISRFSDRNNLFTGSTSIADITLCGKTNAQVSVTVFYELLNSNHEEIESDSVQLTIPEIDPEESVASSVNRISVFPNPSVSNTHAPLFALLQNAAVKQWLENSESGFFFNLPVQDIDWENGFAVSIKIFDALGSTVAENDDLNLKQQDIYLPLSGVRLYWNGCNTQGRKLGSGIYKAMIICRTDRSSKIFFADIGVK